jgi:hypothetical protein
MDNQWCFAYKGQKTVHFLGKNGLVGKKFVGQSMNLRRFVGQIALGIKITMIDLSRRDVVMQFNAAISTSRSP